MLHHGRGVTAVPVSDQPARPRDRAVAALLIVMLIALSAIPLAALWRAFGPSADAAPDFSLTDGDGHPFRLRSLRGRPAIIFFGYTHCPDTCPTVLARLARAVHSAGLANDIRVALITVDPQRDSPAVLKKYVRLFDPGFIGLTGSPAALAPVYSAYGVRRSAVPDGAGQSGYTLQHSTTVYYVGRDGLTKAFGQADDDVPHITRRLQRVP
jgi:protein SCO1/2